MVRSTDRIPRWRTVTAVAGLALIGSVAWFVVPRDRSTVIDLDAAIDRYRSSSVPDTSATVPEATDITTTDTTGTTTTGTTSTGATTTGTTTGTTMASVNPALPEPGVYRYETSGYESIDALGGVRHDYPAITTITVTDDERAGGCGRSLRWDALAERHETWRLCLEGAAVVWQTTSLQYHEFFEQETPEDVTCDVPVPLTGPVSAAVTIQQNCILEDRPWSPTWEHVGVRERTVNGTVVVVHHVRMTIDDTDELPESHVQDWFVRADGLPVEVVVDKRSVNPSPIGGVVEYLESYRIALLDVDPLR